VQANQDCRRDSAVRGGEREDESEKRLAEKEYGHGRRVRDRRGFKKKKGKERFRRSIGEEEEASEKGLQRMHIT